MALVTPIEITSPAHAAQYVRMSTDNQKYSTENQSAVIAKYAAQRNITIVRRYADEGRSGLTLVRRDGLRELIADVQFGLADFDCVLVYDVSRWGRFQDIDESAYYEFICKKAGIKVHYCEEAFQNDGSLASIILKMVSRVEAAEFSRKLSTRVFIGQCRVTELGFWRGGQPCYGLRRQLVDERGVPRLQLEQGQRKFLQTDRVVLKPGPASEVRTVKRVFESFVTHGKTITQIADELNADQIRTTRGNKWKPYTIGKLLTNECYIGNIVFNRTSYKLKQNVVANPPEMWIRRDNALKAIVKPEIFAKAREIIARRGYRLSDREALDRLADLYRKKGYLTRRVLIAANDVPSETFYVTHFGTLTAAYKRIGFRPKPRFRWFETHKRIRSIVAEAVAEMTAKIERLGGRAVFDPSADLLSINENQLVVSIGCARSVHEGGHARWHVRINRDRVSDIALVLRMDSFNIKILDYYLLPFAEITQIKRKRIRISRRTFSKSRRHDNLDAFYRLCATKIAA